MKLHHIAVLASVATSAASAEPTPHDLALRMLASIEQRGQATLNPGASTGFIQLGLFWQALAVVTEPVPLSPANDELRPLLDKSLTSTIPAFGNVTRDAELPLDRFSLGADMVASTLDSGSSQYRPTIDTLRASLALQPRNPNGGLWYYNNVNNLTAYQNLSYLDGMYSFAPFVTISSQLDDSGSNPGAALEMAVQQLQILYDICREPSGLLVHGYDALKAHRWADASTGASPEVWGRALAWYSLGILNTLEVAGRNSVQRNSKAYKTIASLFEDVMNAQLQAAGRSKALTGVPGVWQVVDRPGDAGNFVEASSSSMTVYTLLRGLRLKLLDDDRAVWRQPGGSKCDSGIAALAKDIYQSVSNEYLIPYANGSLSLNGTSSVASLSPQNVGYEYYITRPTELDSLIGTSAFALASYEVGLLDT
ncbi:Unsaturated rhamnogalacturonyl hydrolase YteR [Cyphellophora attinorum]|uniref:Unsaturated rhamnogalacturonyl hydrolase YteR n=1 Tax=Cyphellophora attinorum TaxID=1664694 RepID=A0A0N1H4M8_9EURO|nr:Unsaturated rhamnogalacturonyl hydrolase YteR [Phialophora attinorum]KPI37053.1 Unsaturated rhamnogalacturonyl hydrolase YteR [Phialophora attinorum]